MSSKVCSGDMITHPIPSRNAARIVGIAPGSPMATAFLSRLTTLYSPSAIPTGSCR